MTRTVRANLICDNQPIRTIEELRDHFCIEDVLVYYKNGRLHKWLEARSYNAELEQVNAVTAEGSVDIAKELIRIFGIDGGDEDAIGNGLYMLKYIDAKENGIDFPAPGEQAAAAANADPMLLQYESLKMDILENSTDLEFLKSCCDELSTVLYDFYTEHYFFIFLEMFSKCPLFIYAMLCDPALRKYMLIGEIPKSVSDADKARIERIDALLSSDVFCKWRNIRNILSDHLMDWTNQTEQWKPLVPKGEKVMVIGAHNDVCIRNAGAGESISHDEYQHRYPILNGLDSIGESGSGGHVLFIKV